MEQQVVVAVTAHHHILTEVLDFDYQWSTGPHVCVEATKGVHDVVMWVSMDSVSLVALLVRS